MDERMRMEQMLQEAIENGEFHIYLQPKINMITSKVYGAEALSRWVHPTEGLQSPDTYIPDFEAHGIIAQLDMYMFEEICKLKSRWHNEGVAFAEIPISVNMSRQHMLKDEFVEDLVQITEKYNVKTSELDIEITESMYLNDHSQLTRVVENLQKAGFSVSIDDFGSGYSALNMLKDIPVDTIKIDKEFLQLSANSERGKKVIKNSITLCKDLRFNVMVEGVETNEQVEFLVSYGCEIVQGFYYSKPIPVAEFEEYTKEHFMVSTDVVKFSFQDNLISDDGRYEGEFMGNNHSFVKGISPSVRAVHFNGGRHNEEGISLPLGIIHNDSYTVSMWMKVDHLNIWTAAIFAEYENGFFQFCPVSEYEQACFRIRDRRRVDGWYDSFAPTLEENKWYHVVVMYHRKSGTSLLFINGKVVSFCENVEVLYFIKRLTIGGDIYKNVFEGSICEVIFYDKALEPEEVKELYDSYINMEDFDAYD